MLLHHMFLCSIVILLQKEQERVYICAEKEIVILRAEAEVWVQREREREINAKFMKREYLMLYLMLMLEHMLARLRGGGGFT